MKLDVLGVQAFVALAERESFGKAADSLYISQGALSRRIRKLEDYLGVTLVDRTTRSLQLSRVGLGFLPQARRLLSELQGALQQIREMREVRGGDVTMACVPTVSVRLLPAVLEAYGASYPSNRVSVLDHSAEGVVKAVLERAAEFGIGIAGNHGPDIETEELLHDRFVLVCRKSHRLAKRPRIAWSELAGVPLILPGTGSSNRPLLDDQLPSGIELRAKFEVQRSATAIGLAAAGAGAAIVPGLALQPAAYPMLAAIPLVRPAASRAFVLLRHRGGSLSPAAEALVQIVRRESRAAKRPAA
jgi:DNA-binding transcriptional LysR family regulator